MNLLLDTHVALWAITNSPRLTETARELLLSANANLWVSTASLWEIAIKRSLADSNMPISSDEALHYFRGSGYGILAIEADHVLAVETLEPHHKDPFDRILIAQAIVEPMRLITHDRQLARYHPNVVLI